MLMKVVAQNRRLWGSWFSWGHQRRDMGIANVQHKDAQGNDALANTTGCSAQVGRVVGSLGREGREPDDGVDGVDCHHDLRHGELSGTRESRGHHEIDPGRYGEEELQGAIQVSACFFESEGCQSARPYHCEGPSIVADDPSTVCPENGNP